jgi:hypothetical protein
MKAISITAQKYSTGLMLHVALEDSEYGFSNYSVGFNSIDISPKQFNDCGLTLESPIFRNATTKENFDFFVKMFPILQDWINENNPSLIEFVAYITSKKFRSYKSNFYSYERLDGETVLESLTPDKFLVWVMKNRGVC